MNNSHISHININHALNSGDNFHKIDNSFFIKEKVFHKRNTTNINPIMPFSEREGGEISLK
jgi:hypothetical protein